MSYPSYQNSEVKWLGQLPDHWSVTALKRNFRICGGSTPDPDPKNWNGEISWYTPTDLSGLATFQLGASKRTISKAALFSSGCTLLPEASIVISTRAPIGSLGITTTSGCTNQGCKGLVPASDISPVYYAYLLVIGKAELNSRGRGSTFTEISGEELGGIPVPVPPHIEQTQIARLLDHQTARIDALIAEQQRLIELLKEKRQAVISHAVTKGLDSDVMMKDSGVEWLGEVPEHWIVAQLRYKGKLESGHTPSRSNPDFWVNCTIPWFTLSDVRQIRFEGKQYVYETSEMINEEGLKGSSARLLPAGSVILSRTASVGFPAILGREMAVSQDFAVWVCGRDVDSRFLWFVLLGMKNELKRLMMGSTHQTIYMPDLKYLKAAFPPKKEQEKIVEYLDSAVAKMEQLEFEAHSGIELLQERRSALISAAVTGKIDVRDWEPPVSETFPQSTTSEEAPA